MFDAVNVGRPAPLPVPGIKRTGEQELPFRMPPRGVQEQFIHFLLAVRSIGAHVAQIAQVLPARLNAAIVVGIHASVQRPRHPRPVPPFKFLQCFPAGEREYQIKASDLLRPQIFHAPLFHVGQSHRCIQVIEDA